MKKAIKIAIVVLLLGCCIGMIYAHRRVIKARINGEELPEPPEGHCHGFCHGVKK